MSIELTPEELALIKQQRAEQNNKLAAARERALAITKRRIIDFKKSKNDSLNAYVDYFNKIEAYAPGQFELSKVKKQKDFVTDIWNNFTKKN